MRHLVGISLGDYNGIGPEIILKAMESLDLKASTPVVFGTMQVMKYYRDLCKLDVALNPCNSVKDILPEVLNVLEIDLNHEPIPCPGKLTNSSGLVAMRSIDMAIDFTLSGFTSAIVTAPISKEAVNLAGYHIPGHTEYLAENTNSGRVVMMLVNNELRVALNSVHIPLSDVAEYLSETDIMDNISVVDQSLREDFSISDPKIAVLGLNPHAGDGGVIGTEETEIIQPAIDRLNDRGLKIDGPFPADGFFGHKRHKDYDAIFAMYHDQGLIPFKLIAFGTGVNFTAGLPVIRTSPDHGTAFDIAGTNKADPSSFIEAYTMAVRLSQKRHTNQVY